MGTIELLTTIKPRRLRMDTGYLKFVLNGMGAMCDFVDNPERQYLLAATMSRLMNCDSLLDLSVTFEINKDSLYASTDAVPAARWLRKVRRDGRDRLLMLLRRWQQGDPSYKTRHAVTLCADDFTRTARGDLGGWAGLFYSGAEGGVVPGINMEALVAVHGDGKEVIILDLRIVPPPHDGPGRPPMSRNKWLRNALEALNTFLTRRNVTLKGCPLSVDAAYASHENIEKAKSLGMEVVSKLAVNRRVQGKVWGPVMLHAPAEIFAGLAILLNPDKCKPLREEPGVEYLRKTVYVPRWGREVLMVAFIHDETDLMLYFSTNPNMKAITLRNIVRFRWQLERIFWILKQDIGIGDIHHHRENRVESRIYLHFALAQVLRDAAQFFLCSPKDVLRHIRRSPELVLHELGFPSAFVTTRPQGSVPVLPEAA